MKKENKKKLTEEELEQATGGTHPQVVQHIDLIGKGVVLNTLILQNNDASNPEKDK